MKPKIILVKLPGGSEVLWHFSEDGRPVIYHVGISGGKDSTALLLWMANESGIPHEQIRVTWCDINNDDEETTVPYVQMLSETVFPIETIYPPLDFWELAKKKQRFPGVKARFCTQELKMKPSKAYIDRMGDLGYFVVPCSGVRREESDARKLLPEWGNALESYYALIEWRPLIAWRIEQVWLIHRRYDVSPNPLYGLGAKRVGCFPCFMSRKHEVRMVSLLRPKKINFIRVQENSFPDGKYHSFFPAKTVPDRFCSVSYTNRKGEQFTVASIDDVVAWSRTKLHSRTTQFQFDFPEEQAEAELCPSSMGHCE